MIKSIQRLIRAGLLLLLVGVHASHAAGGDSNGRSVVVWISIDGVRPDYIERTDTPTFDRMRREGAYSLALAPVFPSLTFPNHASQATGVSPGRHGIMMNSFYDREEQRDYSFPGAPRLLQAEPIWITAERQGRRTAVFDWVFSYGRHQATTPSYHADHYSGNIADRERLQLLIDTWQLDGAGTEPLQLLMGYMVEPDTVGHEAGPDSVAVEESVTRMDAKFGAFWQEALELFKRRMTPDDTLYLLVTSDHGMSTVHTVVNPYLLSGVSRDEADGEANALLTSGSVAHIYLLQPDTEEARRSQVDAIVARVSEVDFADVYRREELPAAWGYDHPQRTGDVVISLHTGYTFNRGATHLQMPREQLNSHRGMHGYDVEDNPEMNGIMLVWRYPDLLGGVDLGTTHSLQLHATVAEWLCIPPAPDALADPIRW